MKVFRWQIFVFLALNARENFGISRVEVIQRAQFWQDRNVPYSQSGTHPDPNGIPYRRDCSGFISMCWQLEPHGIGCPWTGNLGTYCNRISRSDLQPGDILLNEAQHVILFEKWANDAHSTYWAFEEVDVGINMKHRSKGLPGNDYFACRYKYIDGANPDPGSRPTGTPCSDAGGHCIDKGSCGGNALEKINNAWSCPGTPGNVWCCVSGTRPSTSPCQQKGGDCINRHSCSANALERIDGEFSCPNDPDDVWCCLPGSGFVVGGICKNKGGNCQSRDSCGGTAVEKIDGSWSCPGTPDDVWCCLPGSLCQSKGGSCIDMNECRNGGKNPVEKFGSEWSCPGTGDNIQCCI